MCVSYMKVKTSHANAPQYYLIPCGKCEECRDSANKQWFFRLRTELEWCRKNKWHIGFFTLTYSDSYVPRLPRNLIKNSQYFDEPLTPMCFNRQHVRDFIDNIRKRLNESYGIKDCRYMVCSEYGSDERYTQRSHYHGLICFPSSYEKVDKSTGEVTVEVLEPSVVFELVHRWKYGHVFPRYITGGRDSSRYEHKPFLLQGDIARAARYASKYTCKDLGYTALEAKYQIDTKSPEYRQYKPFHIQSKSIGLRWLENKSDAQLLKYLREGECFVGDKYRRGLPLYIRNKILYNPYYEFSPCPNGDWLYDFESDKWRYKPGKGGYKRLVRKESSEFFQRNLHQVYEQKLEYYKTLFGDMTDEHFWTSRGLPRERAQDTCNVLSSYGVDRLAVGYLTYYGVPYEKCVYTRRPELFYLSRYRPELNLGHKTLISENFYKTLHQKLGAVFESLKYAQTLNIEKRRLAKRVGDYHKHKE